MFIGVQMKSAKLILTILGVLILGVAIFLGSNRHVRNKVVRKIAKVTGLSPCFNNCEESIPIFEKACRESGQNVSIDKCAQEQLQKCEESCSQ